MPSRHLTSALESLLFISGEPLSFTRLAKTLGISEGEVAVCLQALGEKYAGDKQCGLMIIMKNRKAVLCTKPENARFVEALTKSTLQENLSKAALEVLAIVAYRSPITRAEIEAIRGVNCSFTVRNLLLRDLIERRGNPEDARGYIYFPTFRLLQSLGIKDTGALPDYEMLTRDERLTMILQEDQEENTGIGQKQKTETEK
ncbi:MAG: SMC-Scp complex subunit ScpB [bacterium]|nr:SMC-Scp complex subunit ScpB [bacterium]